MYNYDTMTEAVQGLRQRGFLLDFNLRADAIECRETPITLAPGEFEIVEFYRFEGDSDPADEAVIYAIKSTQGHSGILVNGYGQSADSLSDEMIAKLNVKR